MNKHTDTTRPVDQPTDHAARYARHAAQAPTWTPTDADGVPWALGYNDPWSGDPDRTTRRNDTTPYPYFGH